MTEGLVADCLGQDKLDHGGHQSGTLVHDRTGFHRICGTRLLFNISVRKRLLDVKTWWGHSPVAYVLTKSGTQVNAHEKSCAERGIPVLHLKPAHLPAHVCRSQAVSPISYHEPS